MVNLNLDINNDGSLNAADAQAFGTQVLAIAQTHPGAVRRPHSASERDQPYRRCQLAGCQRRGLGNRDAYIIAAGDQPPANPAFGWGLVDTNNTDDNLGFAFADDILDNFDASFTTPQLVNAVARTVVHEAGHTFGLVHTRAADNLLIAEGAVMGTPADLNADGDTSDPNEDQRDFSVSICSPDSRSPCKTRRRHGERIRRACQPGFVGLRASAPLYITGTGAFDTITVTNVGGGMANVTVNAFDSAARTNMLATTSYMRSFANGLLIEGGLGGTGSASTRRFPPMSPCGAEPGSTTLRHG